MATTTIAFRNIQKMALEAISATLAIKILEITPAKKTWLGKVKHPAYVRIMLELIDTTTHEELILIETVTLAEGETVCTTDIHKAFEVSVS